MCLACIFVWRVARKSCDECMRTTKRRKLSRNGKLLATGRLSSFKGFLWIWITPDSSSTEFNHEKIWPWPSAVMIWGCVSWTTRAEGIGGKSQDKKAEGGKERRRGGASVPGKRVRNATCNWIWRSPHLADFSIHPDSTSLYSCVLEGPLCKSLKIRILFSDTSVFVKYRADFFRRGW